MTHGSLFSGIGGFDLAAEWCGWENTFQVEIDPFCQRVLQKNFPNVQRFSDIRGFDGSQFRGAIDVLSGGFPCQPYSTAGQRRGASDDRALWHEMLRVVGEIQPTWVVGENVVGIRRLGIEKMLADLEALGHETATLVIPACAVGCDHKRERVWILAHADRVRELQPEGRVQDFGGRATHGGKEFVPARPFADIADLAREAYGVSGGLGNGRKIAALGNAIVPQIAYQIFKSINDIYFPQP